MSVAEDVRMYLKNKPYILDTLEKGLVNLSGLARMIQKDLRIKNIQAIKAALRRYSQQLAKSKKRREERVLKVLKGSRITVIDNVSLLVTDRDIPVKTIAKVSVGSEFISVINKDLLKDVKWKYKKNIVKLHENCSVLLLKSPETIQMTPGVVAFQAAMLAEQNINVLELFSRFDDTTIVVDRADVLRSYEILSGIVG